MPKMLMLKASNTSAIQRGQAQSPLYESTGSHLTRCPFLGGGTSASKPTLTASRVFLIIQCDIPNHRAGLVRSLQSHRGFSVCAGVRHEAALRHWHLGCFILLCWPEKRQMFKDLFEGLEALLICISGGGGSVWFLTTLWNILSLSAVAYIYIT